MRRPHYGLMSHAFNCRMTPSCQTYIHDSLGELEKSNMELNSMLLLFIGSPLFLLTHGQHQVGCGFWFMRGFVQWSTGRRCVTAIGGLSKAMPPNIQGEGCT